MAAQRPATFKPGTYFLLNVCFNTAITLSADDHRTISGATYNPNGSLYQEWTFVPTERPGEFLIRSSAPSPNGRPLYATLDGELKNESAIVAAEQPMTWAVDIVHAGEVEIMFPMSLYFMRLSYPDKTVKLFETTRHDEDQFWENSGGDGLDEDIDLFYDARQWKYSLCHPGQAQATSTGNTSQAGRATG